MTYVLALQHHPCETTGTIGAALISLGVVERTVRAFEGEAVPEELGAAGGLVIMGGPMGVYERERYPFLKEEMRLIEEALRRELPVLGICLGSQLLAATLGAQVGPGARKEIGWHEVRLAAGAAGDPLLRGTAERFVAFHWHGDVFPLPKGAATLASSELTPCQAFRWGANAYGFLFHMEITAQGVGDMVREFAGELREAGIDDDGEEIIAQAGRFLPSLNAIGDTVFGRWAGLVGGRPAGGSLDRGH